MNTRQKRIVELVSLAAAEGITLPMAPAAIVALEESGHVVDLVTGNVTLASRLPVLAPTEQGVAKVKQGRSLAAGLGRLEAHQLRCRRGHRRAKGRN